MGQDADSLVQACRSAVQEGKDFTSVWNSILKDHGLVESPPIQVFDDEEARHVEVRLSNGFWLRYSASENDFSLRRAVARRGF